VSSAQILADFTDFDAHVRDLQRRFRVSGTSKR